MKCDKCKLDFNLESYVELSHDIPSYIGGEDKDGRHWLCKKCHREYELFLLNKFLKFLGENKINDDEILFWCIELKKQSKVLKDKLKEIAIENMGLFFKNG